MTRSPRRWPLASFGLGAQVTALVLVLGLVSAMAIQPTRQLLAQQHRISATARELRRTARDNRRLQQQIAQLHDPDFIEQQARAQIGLVRPGETAYSVMPKPAKKGKHVHHRRHKHRPSPPKDQGIVRGFLDFLGL